MSKQTMTVRLDRGELLMPEADVVNRGDIGPGGARGLWDGFGTLTIQVGETPILLVRVQENEQGRAVLRAAAAPGVIASDAQMRAGKHTQVGIEVDLERAELIGPDSTSRDRGWIKEE